MHVSHQHTHTRTHLRPAPCVSRCLLRRASPGSYGRACCGADWARLENWKSTVVCSLFACVREREEEREGETERQEGSEGRCRQRKTEVQEGKGRRKETWLLAQQAGQERALLLQCPQAARTERAPAPQAAHRTRAHRSRPRGEEQSSDLPESPLPQDSICPASAAGASAVVLMLMQRSRETLPKTVSVYAGCCSNERKHCWIDCRCQPPSCFAKQYCMCLLMRQQSRQEKQNAHRLRVIRIV